MEVLVAWRAGLWLWAGFGGLGIWGSLWDRRMLAAHPCHRDSATLPGCASVLHTALTVWVLQWAGWCPLPTSAEFAFCLEHTMQLAVGPSLCGRVPVGPQWVAVSQRLSSPQTGLAHGGIQNLSFKKSAHDFVRSFS